MPNRLDLKKTYRAILDAARNERFISFGDLARANSIEWQQVRREMNRHLGSLVEIAAARDWPALSVIVVKQNDVETGNLSGKTRDGFIKAAKAFGYEVSDPAAFVEKQRQEMFDWAGQAPDELSIPDEDTNVFANPNRQFWFVGAEWDEDQTERFINEGIWQDGDEDRFKEYAARIRRGDRIAIKSTFTQTHNLPFDNQGHAVSVLRVKAIGEVTTDPTTDGQEIRVDWEPLEDTKDWYFHTGKYRKTIAKANPKDPKDRRLIQFAFADDEQDYEFWLGQPPWLERFRISDHDRVEVELEPSYRISDISKDGCFLQPEYLESALSHLKNKKNLILQGPPGTGKTWLGKRLGYALMGTNDPSVVRHRMCSIQFHPSLSYEDFVRGWRPDRDGRLSLIDGVFLQAVEVARQARTNPSLPPYVVVIEEINRGNPAQVFGEMLTLLERDKRHAEEAMELAYPHERGERVFIPDNLFVIGTMNIADRSLALVDLAFRRRFAFVTLEPAFNELWREWCVTQGGIDKSVLTHIPERMAVLNDQIANDRTLGSQFMIGHSYFTPSPGEIIDDSRAWFRSIVESEIAPLLEEYWFDNLDKAAKAKKQLLRDL